MTPGIVLRHLHTRGVILALSDDGESLRCRAPKGVLTTADIALLRQHKDALLALLDRHAEKAALLEFCSGVARAEAEKLAWLTLLPEDPPTENAA